MTCHALRCVPRWAGHPYRPRYSKQYRSSLTIVLVLCARARALIPADLICAGQAGPAQGAPCEAPWWCDGGQCCTSRISMTRTCHRRSCGSPAPSPCTYVAPAPWSWHFLAPPPPRPPCTHLTSSQQLQHASHCVPLHTPCSKLQGALPRPSYSLILYVLCFSPGLRLVA